MAERIPSMERRPNRKLDSRCKCRPSISSIFLSAFANVSLSDSPEALGPGRSRGRGTRKSFPSGKFKGLGCSSQGKVSVPEVIRDSADWPTERLKKKQRSILLKKGKRTTAERQPAAEILDRNSVHFVSPDIWCSPGIGFNADDDSVDCVISRRSVAGRRRIMSENSNISEQQQHQQHHSYWGDERNTDDNGSPSEPCLPFGGGHFLSLLEERQNRRIRHRISDGLAEMMLLHSGLLLGGRPDHYSDLRLDIDNMSYEELLELGDGIGSVSTGLREDEIRSCLRKTRFSMPVYRSPVAESRLKCSICQEEYEEGEDVGKLECGHGYHMGCIRQWLLRKNACPVCKTLVPVC